MTSKTKQVNSRIIRYTIALGGIENLYLFGLNLICLQNYICKGLFGTYHGLRKALHIYYPQPIEENILTASCCTVFPLVAFNSLRPLIPYAVMLIALDAVSGSNDL